MGKINSHLTTALLLLLLLESIFHLSVVQGQPFDEIKIPSMNIISPPYPPNRYENTTVELEIHVCLYNDSPKISSISCCTATSIFEMSPWVFVLPEESPKCILKKATK